MTAADVLAPFLPPPDGDDDEGSPFDITREPDPSTYAHLDAMVATGAEGYLAISTPCPEMATDRTPWATWTFATDQVDDAAQAAADLDRQGRNVYLRLNLLSEPLPNNGRGWSSSRGRAEATGAVVALAVDLDVAGPGHRNGKGDHPLPDTFEEALAIVSELPPPSMTIDTGGGGHLWWLLDEPVCDDAAVVLTDWHDRIKHAGARHKLHVDPPDTARVLRMAGTHRRKPGIPVNPVTLVDVAGGPLDGITKRPWCPPARYGARDLLEALEPPPPPTPPPTSPALRRVGEVGPADAAARLTWAQILEPLRWTFVGMSTMSGATVELWRRPDAASDYSIKAIPDGPAVAWSDSCGLPTGAGQRLSKWRVLVALHFGGDEPGAASTIRRRAREMAT